MYVSTTMHSSYARVDVRLVCVKRQLKLRLSVERRDFTRCGGTAELLGTRRGEGSTPGIWSNVE